MNPMNKKLINPTLKWRAKINKTKSWTSLYSNKTMIFLHKKTLQLWGTTIIISYITIDIGITSVEHPILPHLCLIHDSSSKMSMLSKLPHLLACRKARPPASWVLPTNGSSTIRFIQPQKTLKKSTPEFPSIGETPKNLRIFLPKVPTRICLRHLKVKRY